uniref:prohibitin family protein n=1 Tax=Roseivirga sp. TaxID=1964215 RepID=UPI004047535E
MKSKFSILSIAVIALFAIGCSVVKPGTQAMKWRPYGKGLQTQEVFKDGVVWHMPWNGVVRYNIQWQTYTEQVAVLTKDELHIPIIVSVTLRPIEAELAQLELEVGQDYYKSVVKPEFISLARNIFADYEYKVVSPKSPEIEAAIYKQLVTKIEGKHLEIDNVTIDHIKYPQVVTSAVDRKLAVEQDIQQKDYEMQIAEKQAEIQRILAAGQRDAQQIIDAGLTQKYLQYKALEVQDKLTTSPNTKFYFVPMGKDGLPIIVDTGGDGN